VLRRPEGPPLMRRPEGPPLNSHDRKVVEETPKNSRCLPEVFHIGTD